MDFVGTGRRLQQGDVGDAARSIGVETAVLLAFIEVEAAGRGFDSKNRPKILFEPHVFYRNLSGKLRDIAVREGLAYKRWGTKPYPSSFDERYRQIAAAMKIQQGAALQAASWGLPQILGENHSAAGFDIILGMVTAMMQGEREQLLAMVTLLDDWGLAADLRGKDFSDPDSWRPAVKRYNGSSYAKHNYHGRCAAAYRKHKSGQAMVLAGSDPAILMNGMKGEAVRNLQTDLATLGYEFTLGIDGRYGGETESIVRQFQQEHGLTVDGRAGRYTLSAVEGALADQPDDQAPETPEWPEQDEQHWLAALLEAVLPALFKK